MKTIKFIGMIAILMAVFVSCSDSPEPQPEPSPEPDQPTTIEFKEVSMPMLLEAQNNFAMHFFNAMAQTNSVKNICVSPLSASYALAMAANGAEGETLREIMVAMGFEPDLYSLDDLNVLSAELMQMLNTEDEKISLQLANSVWVDNQLELRPAYAVTLQKYYDANACQFARGTSEAMDAINQWCYNKTNGLINKFYTDVPKANLILLNALIFNGKFTKSFDDMRNKRLAFTNRDGNINDVAYVSGSDSVFCYQKFEGYQCASKRYGENLDSPYWLDIILPDKGVRIDEVLANFDVSKFNPTLYADGKNILELSIPKLNLDIRTDMIEALKLLGMNRAFNFDLAEFPNIVTNSLGLYITDARQAISFELNADGTTASTITDIEMTVTDPGPSGDTPKFIDFEVNRPFVYMVRNSQTRTILFIGVVKQL